MGGTTKRTVARASLQRFRTQSILNVNDFVDFCNSNVKGIIVQQLDEQAISNTRISQKISHDNGQIISGTMSIHYFVLKSKKFYLKQQAMTLHSLEHSSISVTRSFANIKNLTLFPVYTITYGGSE